MHIHVHVQLYIHVHQCFLLAHMVQGNSYLAQHSSLFGPDRTVNYIVTNSINSLLIGSKYNTNGTHTNHC